MNTIHMEYSTLLDQILYLLDGYSRVRRKNTQPYNRELYQDISKTYDPDNLMIRESLIEHVGSLPIIAATIFPYIGEASVDIGDVLTMLAVHDIGELVVGDEIGFLKKDNKKEAIASLKMLHPIFHDSYRDIESQTSMSGKFAKSIDKLAPEFFDIMCDADTTITRYKKHMDIGRDEIVTLKRTHKTKYMKWDPYILGFYEYLCDFLEEKLNSI